uniref:Secreted Cystatin-like protein n=1 Tax=Pristhesancus plagipennis TaxID=1955184 RepID=A0A2K8JPB8_PRIPG|nr:secreted Cystatin-like protein [Pristhesancus plagipennis]
MFAAKLVSVLLLLCALDCAIASKYPQLKPRICAGCVIPIQNNNDSGVINMVKKVINRQNQRLTFVKILGGSRQVIRGIKYGVTFEAKSRDGRFICSTSFITFSGLDVRSFRCEPKKKSDKPSKDSDSSE